MLRLYRGAALLLLLLVVHRQAAWLEEQSRGRLTIRQARRFFPTADRLQLRDADRGLHMVLNSRGDPVGALLRTSPFTDRIIGYSGPSDVLIALDMAGAIAGVEVLRSGDTPEYVEQVKRSPAFLKTFQGWNPAERAPPGVDAVSGATLTSLAMAESIQQRLTGAAASLRFPDPVAFAEMQSLFPKAAQAVPQNGRWRMLDASGQLLGFVVRTAPQADNVAGYRGPTESLVALAADGRTVTGLRLRRSYDTESYVDQVRRAQAFSRLFVGQTIEELAGMQYPRQPVDGVSGATMTARAVAEGVKRRFDAELRASPGGGGWQVRPRDWGLAATVAGALLFSFTPVRGWRWIRVSWQVYLVVYVGLISHDFVSLALLGGWSKSGIAWATAPGLVLLAAAALLVPWTTRRQLYCHQICPHGAAQQLLGKLGRVVQRRWASRGGSRRVASAGADWQAGTRGWAGRLAGVFELAPGALLAVGLVALLRGWKLDLASLEAFDAWVWPAAGLAAILIAASGLVASLFVPLAYCRFGCPTGALLSFLRSSGSGDGWGRRDWAALGFLALAGLTASASRIWPRAEPEPAPLELRGLTMGSPWSVKVRDEVPDPTAIEKIIQRELDWAESLTSHTRTNSDLFEFNRTATTNAWPVPWPVLTLTRSAAEISRLTGGASDVTAGPLERLWTFGASSGSGASQPGTEEIQRVLRDVGWQKLEVLDGMLRKQTPGLEVDLFTMARGWAIDHAIQVLERRGYTNVLVEWGGHFCARGRWAVAADPRGATRVLSNECMARLGNLRPGAGDRAPPAAAVIDPRTGRPVAHRAILVSVRHSKCADAGAWAAAFRVLGAEEGLPLAERLKLAVQFVIERPGAKVEVRESGAWAREDERGGSR